jgi:hypothetical protein
MGLIFQRSKKDVDEGVSLFPTVLIKNVGKLMISYHLMKSK